MFRRSTHFLVVLAAVAATTSMTAVAHADYRPRTEIIGGGPVIPLKNAAMISRTDGGYRYIAGQQDTRLTITRVNGGLRYADTGTQKVEHIPKSCHRQSVSRGIAVLCSIPAQYQGGNKMFLEVWPRLGDDFVDGSSLSSVFRVWVLGDKGNDTMRGGDGADFFNGAQDHDKASGGAGNDWIRTGIGNDVLWGGSGDDKLVATYDNDVIRGGAGNDRISGGPGRDALWADSGRDFVSCGSGRDRASIDRSDRTNACESVGVSGHR